MGVSIVSTNDLPEGVVKGYDKVGDKMKPSEIIDSVSKNNSEVLETPLPEGRYGERLEILGEVSNYLAGKSQEINGKTLNAPQLDSLVGFQKVLSENLNDTEFSGFVLLPPRLGKTLIATLYSSFVNNKFIYVSWNTNGVEQAHREFTEFYSNSGSEKTIGCLTGNNNDTTPDILIINPEKFMNLCRSGDIDLGDVGMVIVDEADVNFLSERRINFSSQIFSAGSILIGMTGTDMQYSRRQLADLFRYKIITLPLPESLPEVYKKDLYPNVIFKDVKVEGIFGGETLEENDYLGLLYNANQGGYHTKCNNFIVDTNLYKKVFDDYLENYNGEQFVIGLNNNILIDLFIDYAEKKGITLERFTGNTLDKGEVLERYDSGETKGLIGSFLVGRQLDVPDCSVFFNLMFTKSPQKFWQALARSMTLTDTKKDVSAKSVTYYPSHFVETSVFDLLPHLKHSKDQYELIFSPLRAFDFINPYLNQNNIVDDIQNNELKDMEDGDLKSGSDLQDEKEKIRLDLFIGRSILAANIIKLSSITDFNRGGVYSMINESLDKQRVHLLYLLKGDRNEEDISYLNPEDQILIDYYYKEYTNVGYINKFDEFKLWRSYKEDGCRDSINKILAYHMPVLIELAKKEYQNLTSFSENLDVTFSDFLHDFIEIVFFKKLKNYDISEYYSGLDNQGSIDEIGGSRILSYILKFPISNIELVFDLDDYSYIFSLKPTKKEYSKNKACEITKRELKDFYNYISNSGYSIEDISGNKILIRKLSTLLEYSEEKFENILHYFCSVLNGNNDNEDDIEGEYDPYEIVEYEQFKSSMDNSVQSLSSRESEVIQMIYSDKEYSLDEVGKVYDTTKERIRQIEAKALRKLRHPSITAELRSFLGYEGLNK